MKPLEIFLTISVSCTFFLRQSHSCLSRRVHSRIRLPKKPLPLTLTGCLWEKTSRVKFWIPLLRISQNHMVFKTILTKFYSKPTLSVALHPGLHSLPSSPRTLNLVCLPVCVYKEGKTFLWAFFGLGWGSPLVQPERHGSLHVVLATLKRVYIEKVG